METITIEKMTYGIDALGHLNGKVVFVPYGAPRDKAEIDILEQKTDYARASLTRIVEPSPHRQLSPCPNFPECGGCHWLHLFPEVQRQEKEAYLNFLVKPFAPRKVYPIEGLADTRYRNKMELKVQCREDGTVVLGNYKYRTHDVVSLKGCIVQCAPNMAMYEAFRAFLEADPERRIARNTLEIMVRTLPPQQHALITLREAPDEAALEAFRGFFNNNASLGRLEIVAQNTSYLTLMREQEPFTFMKRQWTVSPRSFFQNNLEGAEAIFYTLLTVHEAVPQKGKLLDLYCGVGIQTLLLENRFEETVGVECNDDSYQDALRNQKIKGSNRTRFVCRKAEAIFGTPFTKGVIAALHVNPPRTGLSQRVLRGMSGIKPKKITYLSCNPMTFRRDAQAITRMGYRLEQVHAFDLFPGTYHLEILGTFVR